MPQQRQAKEGFEPLEVPIGGTSGDGNPLTPQQPAGRPGGKAIAERGVWAWANGYGTTVETASPSVEASRKSVVNSEAPSWRAMTT